MLFLFFFLFFKKNGAPRVHFFPPPDKHNPSNPFTQISSFHKIFTSHSVPQLPPSLILYLEDKPHFIPMRRRAEKNMVRWHTLWSDDSFWAPSEDSWIVYVFIYRLLCLDAVREAGETRLCCFTMWLDGEVMTKPIFWSWQRLLGLFMARGDGWAQYKHQSKHFSIYTFPHLLKPTERKKKKSPHN